MESRELEETYFIFPWISSAICCIYVPKLIGNSSVAKLFDFWSGFAPKMSQGGSAQMLSGGSQSCPVMAKTDNAQSIINILTAIHLKRDIVRPPLPSLCRARRGSSCPPPTGPRAVGASSDAHGVFAQFCGTAARSRAPAGCAHRALTCRGVAASWIRWMPAASLCVVHGIGGGRRRTA